MVGVNVRSVGDYGGVIKYALTLPALLDSIQLLPIWEPGVVSSLYGIASWNLNREFYSGELREYARHHLERRTAHQRGSHKARLQHPDIDLSKCIGCGRCFKVCPRDVFDLVERDAHRAHGKRARYTELSQHHCGPSIGHRESDTIAKPGF